MHELQLDPQWGFVPVRGKAAYENGWSDNPHDWLTLKTKRQVPWGDAMPTDFVGGLSPFTSSP
jgi:hypothetical protein